MGAEKLTPESSYLSPAARSIPIQGTLRTAVVLRLLDALHVLLIVLAVVFPLFGSVPIVAVDYSAAFNMKRPWRHTIAHLIVFAWFACYLSLIVLLCL